MPHKARAETYKIKKVALVAAYLFRFGYFPIKLELGYGLLVHIYFLDFREFMRFIGNKNNRMAGTVGELSRLI